jgi:thioredoxin reductase (NADPH)
MLAALQALRGEMGLDSVEIEVIDVDADPALEAKYDELVPVLVDAADNELCHYHLDVPKVREYLDGLR